MARIPSRSDERTGHRTKAELEANKPTKVGSQTIKWHRASSDWHPIARRWYNSLRTLPVASFYLQSDVETAYLCAEIESRMLAEEEIKAAMLMQVRQMKNDLMSTEGSRRLMRIETSSDEEVEKQDLAKTAMNHYRGLGGSTDDE